MKIHTPQTQPATVAKLALLLSTILGGQAWAGADAENVPKPTVTAADLAAKRHEVAQRVDKLIGVIGVPKATPGEPTALAAASELKLLRNLDLVYLHHQTALEQSESAAADGEQLEEELLSIRSSTLSAGTRYSWLLLEDLRDQLDAEEARAKSHSVEVAAAHSALATARDLWSEAERVRRQVLDEPIATDEPSKASAQEYRRRSATLEADVARATVELRRVELDLKRRLAEIGTTRRTLLAERVDRMQPLVVYPESDLKHRQQMLAAYEAELRGRLGEAQADLQRLDAQQFSALDRSAGVGTTPDPIHPDRAAGEDGGNSHETVMAAYESSSDRLQSLSEPALRELRRLAHEEVIEAERQLAEFQASLDAVVQRFRFVNGLMAEDERRSWAVAMRQTIERLAEEDVRLELFANDLAQDLVTLHRAKRLASTADTGDSNAALSSLEINLRMAALERLSAALEFGRRQNNVIRRSAARFVADLEPAIASTSETPWLTQWSGYVGNVWSYELLAVGDQPITVGKVVKGLLGLLVGLFASAMISRLIGRRVLPRLGMNPGGCEALRSLSFYTLCILFAILSMEVARVPLTAFTFLGGAAAIGVGFGSQNVLNNFISGLILLAEQPIRVGDVVEYNGLQGIVYRIGARSTVVQTGDNVEIVVPNSKLLENNVSNFTLRDNRVRTRVGIGVAYGSPVAVVKRLLIQAARMQQDVIDQPGPVVLFTDFADNSLNFEVLFWVQISATVNCRRVESDVREAIDQLFRDGGISIAFPQRDIHLDTSRPLEIRLADPVASTLPTFVRKAA